MMANLPNIGHLYLPCGPNLGGLSHVRVIPADNVKQIMAPVDHIVPTDLLLHDPDNYLDIFLPEPAGFKEPMAVSDQGIYYKPEIECLVAKDTPDAAYWISRLAGIRCVALYVDGNGFYKLVGDADYPLTFSADLEISGSKNGYSFRFSGDSTHAAYFYQAFEVVPPGSRKVFSSGFTFGFLRQ